MRTIVIYGGRFQPFHNGHLAVYNHLVEKFNLDDVYIATSNSCDYGKKNSKNPFTFDEKVQIISHFGINPNKVLKVTKSPIFILKEDFEELGFNSCDHAYITVVGEKDRSRYNNIVDYAEYKGQELKPMSEMSYFYVTDIGTKTGISATDIRNSSSFNQYGMVGELIKSKLVA